MDVQTLPGDVYFVNGQAALYGEQGIELRLSSRNLANMLRAQETSKVVRDTDVKHRRFNVSWDADNKEFLFEPTKGAPVRSPAWLFTPDKQAS